MRKLLIALALLPSLALAQVNCPKIADNKAHVCWTAPTTNTDGSPIVLALTYKIEVLNPGATVWVMVAQGVIPTDWTSAALQPGTYKYRVYAVAGGQTSDARDGAPDKVVPNVVPGPVGGAIVAEVVKEIKYSPVFSQRSPGYFMGYALVGSECTGSVIYTYRGRAYRRPSKWVPMNGVSQFASVVAPCTSI